MKKAIKEIWADLFEPIDTEAGGLINIPNFLIRWSRYMSLNAVFQAIVDITIEIIILAGIVSVKLPFRLEFLFLTIISSVIAYLTLRGLREGALDVTKNTLLVGWFVESSLFLGDVYLLINTDPKDFWTTLLIRLPFMLLTASNIILISYIIRRNILIRRSRPNYRF